jgi:hypothetical protein
MTTNLPKKNEHVLSYYTAPQSDRLTHESPEPANHPL